MPHFLEFKLRFFLNSIFKCVVVSVIVKSCKQSCVSNALDGTDYDVVWNDSEEDGIVSISCEEDESGNYKQ
jgi:hypothetical protein